MQRRGNPLVAPLGVGSTWKMLMSLLRGTVARTMVALPVLTAAATGTIVTTMLDGKVFEMKLAIEGTSRPQVVAALAIGKVRGVRKVVAFRL